MLIAAILEELGYFDEKKEKDRKGEINDERREHDNSKHSGEGEHKQK